VVVPFLEIERPPTTVRHAEVTSPDAIEILTPSGLRVCVPPKFDDEARSRLDG
jgi:hypothetical protein